MEFIDFNSFDSFSTEFTSNKILQLINEYLVEEPNYKITEESYDSTLNKIWHIELFTPTVIDVALRYIICVTYLQGKTGEPNLVKFKFMDKNNVTYLCEDKIFALKYFIIKKERAHKLRYFEREPLLLLINTSITNYHHFSSEDLKQINAEKMTSKKRRILENPWFQREIAEYIDYVQPVITKNLLRLCTYKNTEL